MLEALKRICNVFIALIFVGVAMIFWEFAENCSPFCDGSYSRGAAAIIALVCVFGALGKILEAIFEKYPK